MEVERGRLRGGGSVDRSESGFPLRSNSEMVKSFTMPESSPKVVTLKDVAARAGLSLAQGIENVAQETPEPLATELHRIVRDYRGGRPLPRREGAQAVK
mgnify:CR=1 FL=1